jgi:hypothetical protein
VSTKWGRFYLQEDILISFIKNIKRFFRGLLLPCQSGKGSLQYIKTFSKQAPIAFCSDNETAQGAL